MNAGKFLRLIPPKQDYFEPAGSKVPSWRALEPSSGDKREAATRRIHIRVSVWDRARTSVSDARAHHSNPEALVYEGDAAQILAEAAQHACSTVQVVHDPCSPVHGELSGCDGHHGIEGLDSVRSGLAKNARKSMLIDMAKGMYPV
jgi:hypothetical protein